MFLLRKKTLLGIRKREYIENWTKKFFVFFTFFINFFMKTLIKNIMYCEIVPLNRLLIYFVKTIRQASLLSFLTWVSLAIFYLDQCQMEIVCSAQHHCPRLHKLHESGNRTEISDEKWRSAKTKYLENKKW